MQLRCCGKFSTRGGNPPFYYKFSTERVGEKKF